MAERAARASRNFLETFPFFAAASTGRCRNPPSHAEHGPGIADLFLGEGGVSADLHCRCPLLAHGGVCGLSFGAFYKCWRDYSRDGHGIHGIARQTPPPRTYNRTVN